ncbi:glycoside hydrolase family 11 protein [Ruminococcus sp.]|uniref:glycoside hydrolase family 11 protein n=1 Tax=Ruminococcus sp. TaxID=41978 RepID=UPI0025FCFBBD|nr:glycoside hydrolase family 11 protein [Ruminococcus sp.]
MKLKKFKRIISGTVSAMMIAASIPAVASAADQQTRGNIGGYDYEMWNQNGQGQVSMNPGAGSFTCSWSNIENFLARMGKNFDSQKQNYKAFGNIVLTYDVEYTPRGNSYMCVYGWTRNPLMEYYIVEGWGDWRPPGDGAERKGNVTLNGNSYEIAKTMRYNQPSLDGTATFPQYWSIRSTSGSANNQTNYMKGTIDVSKHFDAWAQAGLDMSGTLYEVSLNIEGYRSNGSANVKSVTVSTGGADSGNAGGGFDMGGGNDWNQGGNDWNQGGFDFGNMGGNNGGFDFSQFGGQGNNDWNQGGQDWSQGGFDFSNMGGNNGGFDFSQFGGQGNNDWNQGGNNGGFDWNNGQQNNDWNSWGGNNDWNNWSSNDWSQGGNNGGFDWNNGQQNNGWDNWNNGQQNNNWNNNQNDNGAWYNWGVNDWNNNNGQQQNTDWNNWNQGGNNGGFDWNQGGNNGGFDWNQGGNNGGFDWNQGGNNGGFDWNQGGNNGGFDWSQGGNNGGFDWSQGGNNGGFDWSQGGNNGGFDWSQGGNNGGFDWSQGGNNGGFDWSQGGNNGGFDFGNMGGGNDANIDWNGMAGGFNNGGGNIGSDPGNGGNAQSGLNAKIRMDMPTSVPGGVEKSGACKVEKKTYNCKYTGGQKSCNVILPPNYSASKQYPVMYVLHGIGGDENSMVSGMGVQELLAGLIAKGEAEEMIIVLPSQYTSKNGNGGGGFGINQETCEAYDNFLYDISDSLIPFIESNYSVKTGRENRAITGFSMGGREAIYIGLMRPDLFGYVGGACPAPGITPGKDMFMEHPGCMQESEMKFRNIGPEPAVFMITGGTNDSVVGTFPQQYSEILTRNGVEHVYQSIPGGGHGADSVKPHLYTFMRYAFK